MIIILIIIFQFLANFLNFPFKFNLNKVHFIKFIALFFQKIRQIFYHKCLDYNLYRKS